MDSEEKTFTRHRIELESALEQREFELEHFWKRSWFFGLLILALVSGFFKLKGTSGNYEYTVGIAFVACLVSLGQSLMCRGSKYWQERWEYVVKNRESQLGVHITKTDKFIYEKVYIDRSIKAKKEDRIMRSWRISVSKITFIVWDIITFSLFANWINEILPKEFNGCFCFHQIDIKLFLFHFAIILYLVVIFRRNKFNRIYENLVDSIDEWDVTLKKRDKEGDNEIANRYRDNDITLD